MRPLPAGQSVNTYPEQNILEASFGSGGCVAAAGQAEQLRGVAAIMSSSFVGMTHAVTRLPGREIRGP